MQMRIRKTGVVVEILCASFDFHTSNIQRAEIKRPRSLSCDAEAQFDGRPKGVRTTDSVTEIRTTERYAFSRASAISRPAPLFCILFSGKTEKSMPSETQLQCYCKNDPSGESGESLPHPPDAVPPRLRRGLRPPGAVIPASAARSTAPRSAPPRSCRR